LHKGIPHDVVHFLLGNLLEVLLPVVVVVMLDIPLLFLDLEHFLFALQVFCGVVLGSLFLSSLHGGLDHSSTFVGDSLEAIKAFIIIGYGLFLQKGLDFVYAFFKALFRDILGFIF
jgi:hypothetical protein